MLLKLGQIFKILKKSLIAYFTNLLSTMLCYIIFNAIDRILKIIIIIGMGPKKQYGTAILLKFHFFFANFKSPDRMSCTLDFMHFFFRVRRMSRKNYYIGGPIMTNIIFLAAALHNFKHDMS